MMFGVLYDLRWLAGPAWYVAYLLLLSAPATRLRIVTATTRAAFMQGSHCEKTLQRLPDTGAEHIFGIHVVASAPC